MGRCFLTSTGHFLLMLVSFLSPENEYGET